MKTLALAGALTLALTGCSADQMSGINADLITTAQNVVALNNALVQVNGTLIDNVVAQAKLLAPYQCGAFALATAILADSSASAKVNAYLKKDVAAKVTSVAVKDICAALGYRKTIVVASAASP